MKRWAVMIAGLTALLYAGTVVAGLRAKSLSPAHAATRYLPAWAPPPQSSIPAGAKGESIRLGALIFTATPVYAPQYAGARLNCSSCHPQGGMQPWASPVVGVAPLFPMYSKRAGRMISLEDRIEECFVRSENGRPLPYNSPEMRALADYIAWLSQPQSARAGFEGRGLVTLPDLKADAVHGAQVYAEQCAGCHGLEGEGDAPLFPPLWGPDSFNDGAGMYDVSKMARFVAHNMPQNRMGDLSAQDAVDVAAFIHTKPRPAFDRAYEKY